MIKSIRQGSIYYFEPQNIADYNPEMMNVPVAHQSYSGKTYDIKFAYGLLRKSSLNTKQLSYLSNICKRSPSLRNEIIEILLRDYQICLL